MLGESIVLLDVRDISFFVWQGQGDYRELAVGNSRIPKLGLSTNGRDIVVAWTAESVWPEIYHVAETAELIYDFENLALTRDRARVVSARVVGDPPVLEIQWETDLYEAAHDSPGVERHWIPNTQTGVGEYEVLAADSMTVVGITPVGREVSVNQAQYGGEFVPVRFLPPEDLYGDEEPEPTQYQGEFGNIYENHGAGIDIVVFDSQANEWQTIARYTLSDPRGPDDRLPYGASAVPDPDWAQEDQDGSRLFVWQDQLAFRPEGSRAGDPPLTQFGVRAHDEGGAVRPGDDFLLRIGYSADWPEGAQAIGSAAPEDFVAVYDKRMLWRANLYIDEGDGPVDWNNANRWSFGNAWNRLHDGTVTQPLDLLPAATGSAVDGGQTVEIVSFTPIWELTEDGPAGPLPSMVDNRVAYSVPYRTDSGEIAWTDGHFDSPFDHNNKLAHIQESISALWAQPEQIALFNDDGLEGPENVGPLTLTTLQNWPFTSPGNTVQPNWTAPNHIWGNYAMESIAESLAFVPSLGLYDSFGSSSLAPENAHTIPGQTVNLVGAGGRSGDTTTYPYAVGTDCIGFAQRSAGYGGNRYMWTELPSWSEEGQLQTTSLEPGISGRAYPRTPEDAAAWIHSTVEPISDAVVGVGYPPEDDSTADFDEDSLSRIVPGDVLYYITEQEAYGIHIGIVRSVHDENDDGTITLDEVRVIESRYSRSADRVTWVTTNRTLSTTPIPDRRWRVVRLRNE